MTEPHDHDEPDARLDRQLSELLSDAVSDVEPTNAPRHHPHPNEGHAHELPTPLALRRRRRRPRDGRRHHRHRPRRRQPARHHRRGRPGPGRPDQPDPGPDAERVRRTPAPPTRPRPRRPRGRAPGAARSRSTSSARPPRACGSSGSSSPASRATRCSPRRSRPSRATPSTPTTARCGRRARSVDSVESDGAQVLTVDIDRRAARPARPGMTQAEAQLALQQVVYSVQAAQRPGPGRRPAAPRRRALRPGPGPADVRAARQRAGASDAVDDEHHLPRRGRHGLRQFTATASTTRFEATSSWQVLDGEEVVAEGFGTADGCCEDKLFPWETEVDVSMLDPGAYTFVASNSDPSGGTEGGGPHVDTRVFVVE